MKKVCSKHGIVDTYSSNRCSVCCKESNNIRYKNNKEKYLEINRRWIENNPDKVAIIKRRWLENNKESRRESIHRYYQKNKDIILKNAAEWRRKNSDKRKDYEDRRRAKKYNAEINDFTKKEWLELLVEHAHACFYCGSTDKKLTQDHIVPLYKGGNHTKGNIVPACLSCNSRKHINTNIRKGEYAKTTY